VVEHLPSKHKALSLNPTTAKKKKKKEKREFVYPKSYLCERWRWLLHPDIVQVVTRKLQPRMTEICNPQQQTSALQITPKKFMGERARQES
jgi:hypothetical protein